MSSDIQGIGQLHVSVSDLESRDGGRFGPERVDVRCSRWHQKTMQFGHHNHDYSYGEQYLVRRARLEKTPENQLAL